MQDDIGKVGQNLELYKQVVRDPVSYCEGILSGMIQEMLDGGEELGEDADERIRSVVQRALAQRHLTNEEEAMMNERA